MLSAASHRLKAADLSNEFDPMVIQVRFGTDHSECRRAGKTSRGRLVSPVLLIPDHTGGIIAHDDLVVACKQASGTKQAIFHSHSQNMMVVLDEIPEGPFLDEE